MVVVLCVSLCACGLIGSKNIELGDTVKAGIVNFTVKDVELGNTNYVKINDFSTDYLTPINKDDLKDGDSFIKSDNEDDGVAIITVVLENAGKTDASVGPNSFIINYDNGNKYYASVGYVKTTDGCEKTDKIVLEKVISGATEAKFIAWIPNVIIDSTESLTLDFYGYSYKIR